MAVLRLSYRTGNNIFSYNFRLSNPPGLQDDSLRIIYNGLWYSLLKKERNMSNVQSAVTNAAYATAIGFVATKGGIVVSNALNSTVESARIAEVVLGVSEITLLATGAITGMVTALGMLKACFISAGTPREAARLVITALQEDDFLFQPAVIGSGIGAGLAWKVGEEIKAITSAKEEIIFKVANAVTIGSLMFAFSRVNRVALLNIALGAFAAEMTGILLSHAFPSLPVKASVSAVIGGTTTGMLTLACG